MPEQTIDFSGWTEAEHIHYRSRGSVRSRNPLTPGGEAPAAPPVQKPEPQGPVQMDSPDLVASELLDLALAHEERMDRLMHRVQGIAGLRDPSVPMPEGDQERYHGGRGRDLLLRVAAVLEGGTDPYARRAATRIAAKALADDPKNSDLSVAVGAIDSPAEDTMTKTKKADEKPPKTTYYNEFPNEPRPGSVIIHVFWVVANDYRMLNESERRNIVYPAKHHGLMEAAPKDDRQTHINLKGEVSRCRFILTKKGEKYYKDHVQPQIPKDFKSILSPPKAQRGKREVSTASLRG